MSSKQSAVMKIANQMAREIVANQTLTRLTIGFDGAIIAAHEVFQMGPGRSAAFREAYNRSVETLAHLFLDDYEDNKDAQIDYAKGTRDEIIKKIVGEENFIPFDRAYGEAWIDELKRIRIAKQQTSPQWISAEEKPDPFEVVDLAILSTGGDKPAYYTTIGCFEHNEWRSLTGPILSDETVTHWKPRPLPPQFTD